MSDPLDLFGADTFTPSPARPDAMRSRRLSPKQAAIMDAVRKAGAITLDEATALVGGNVYHNAKKHTGALLANMVNIGLLAREKAGTFTKGKL